MARWVRKLDVSDVWEKAQERKIAVRELSAIVEQRLRKVPDIGNDDLDYAKDELADEFRDLAEDESADWEWFDDIWGRLYDWGDTPLDRHPLGNKLCWIATF